MGYKKRCENWRRLKVSDTVTLARIRVLLERHAEEGVICPACERAVKVYKRQISPGTARWLVELVKRAGRERKAIHTGEIIKSMGTEEMTGTDATTILPFWKLITSVPSTDPDKSESGYWRPTQKGVQFVEGYIKIPKTAVMYNGKLIELAGRFVDIEAALVSRKTVYDIIELLGRKPLAWQTVRTVVKSPVKKTKIKKKQVQEEEE